MPVTFKIAGEVFESSDYQVTEDATPLAAGDSSGSVGTITVAFPEPDPDLNPEHELSIFGAEVLLGRDMELLDDRKGFTLGQITGVSTNGGLISVDCRTRLGELNAFDVQAQPFSGTLEEAFEYYLGLANIDTDFIIDDSLASRPVTFPGWNGELWVHFKELATSQDCDIALVSGVILFRPLRTREAIRGRDVQKVRTYESNRTAQFVEIYQYNNAAITDEMVYPPNGWISDDTIFNVDAGSYSEYTLNLNASLSSVLQPVAVSSVGANQTDENGSVYTITTDDGTVLSPSKWTNAGGRVEAVINPDTTSVTVRIFSAHGVFVNRRRVQSYSLALPADEDGALRTTFRLVGSGVSFRKELHRIPTSLPASQTATEVGETIDNPFISTTEDMYRAVVRTTRQYMGSNPTFSATVTSVNKRGDTGEAQYVSYGEVEDLFTGITYGDIESTYGVSFGWSYQELQDTLYEEFANDDVNQVFGNVQGARVWDPKSRRWYRITSGTIGPGVISVDGEDDLLHEDMETFFAGLTYSDVEAVYAPRTYTKAELMGMYKGPVGAVSGYGDLPYGDGPYGGVFLG